MLFGRNLFPLMRAFGTSSLLAALTLAVVFAAGVVQAGTILPGQYQLLDHPDGDIVPPPYGLRIDDLGITLSAELGGAYVVLDWDGGATATITGTLFNNSTLELWTVSYTMTGVVAAPANLGFSASAATGTLTDPLFNVTVLTGEQDGSGSVFDFLADGHRLGSHPAFGDADTAVGRGWLLPPGSTDDWLVRAVLVPEPGTALLVGLGLIGLAVRQRVAS